MSKNNNVIKIYSQNEVTTLATCFKITRKDNQSFGFTDCSNDLIIDNLTYYADSSYISSNISTTSQLNVDNLELKSNLKNVSTSVNDVTISHSIISEDDLRKGIWDSAYVQIFMVDYNDLTKGILKLKDGWIGEITSGRTTFNAEFRGKTQILQQNIGFLVTPTCTANLGDSKCKVNLLDYTFDGTVTTVLNQHSWIDTSLNQTNSTTTPKAIQNIALDTTTYIQCNGHGFTSGNSVTLSAIKGSCSRLNGMTGIVGYIDSNNFSLNIDSSEFVHYVAGASPAIKQNTSYSNNFVATYNGTWNTNGGSYNGGGNVTSATSSEYFQGGKVTWLTGQNAGFSMEVKNYNPNYVFLFQAMINPINIGDTYTISAGCDKIDSTCYNRFNNIKNFRGFNLIPGNDKLMSGA